MKRGGIERGIQTDNTAQLRQAAEALMLKLGVSEMLQNAMNDLVAVCQDLSHGQVTVKPMHHTPKQCGYAGYSLEGNISLSCPVIGEEEGMAYRGDMSEPATFGMYAVQKGAVDKEVLIKIIAAPRAIADQRARAYWESRCPGVELPVYRTDKLLHDGMRQDGWTDEMREISLYFEVDMTHGDPMYGQIIMYFLKDDKVEQVQARLAQALSTLKEKAVDNMTYLVRNIRQLKDVAKKRPLLRFL